MRQVDFNYLPRASREQFVRSLVSDMPTSAPLASRVARERALGVWYALLGLGSFTVVLGSFQHFGELAHPVQGRGWLLVYVLACAAIGLAGASLVRRRALAGALPYTPGVYVFPLDLVDARAREIVLFPLSDLLSVEAVHDEPKGVYRRSTLWLVFPAESFTFEVKGRAEAEAQAAKIQGAKQVLVTAIQRSGVHELATLDPFAEAKARDFVPMYDHGLLAREAPVWTRFVWATPIVIGLVLGVAVWRVRNHVSDGRAFARLAKSPTDAAARAYVDGGGLRAAEVTSTIVPRARLDAAMKETGTKRLLALERFLAESPRATPADEARAAFAQALHEQYAATQTVSGLRAFVERWPASPDAAAARARIHELYQQALADIRAHANADKALVPAVEALLALAEQRPEGVEVRLRRRGAGSLALADRLLVKGLLDDDGPAKGGNAEASPAFGPDAIARREATLVAGLERAFRKVFPADLLPLRRGAAFEDADRAADAAAAVLFVEYEIGWAGSTYVAAPASRRFLGLSASLDVTIRVPNEARPLAFALRVVPPDAALPGEPGEDAASDEHAYDVILLRAFEHAGPRLVVVFFDPRTAAARVPEGNF